jgi:glycosyltransferase involved in cell wall biosynthesis
MSTEGRSKEINLLVIAPHFKYFIEDQVIATNPFLKSTTVVIPLNRFSPLVTHLPYLRDRFYRVRNAVESVQNRFKYKDVEIVPSYISALPTSKFRKRSHILAARNIAKQFRKGYGFSIIHAQFMDTPGYIGALLKKEFGTPLVVTGHGWDVYDLPFRDEWHNDLAKQVLNEADQIITVSKSNANKLREIGAPPQKLNVIPNCYNDNLFKPLSQEEARKSLNLPLDKKLLLSVGSLVEVKGHTYLIDSMQTILKSRKDLILIIVGSGPLEADLRKKVKKLGLNKNILFTGERKHEEIPVWMNACDLFVLPSLNESFGVVLIEAMACGKPVIGTQVGGVPEIITTDEVGRLIRPKDSEVLAMAVLEALDKEWSTEKILEQTQRYSWNKIAKRILSVYQKVLRSS